MTKRQQQLVVTLLSTFLVVLQPLVTPNHSHDKFEYADTIGGKESVST